MNASETLALIANELRDLFKDGGELKGLNDWDRLLGCIIAIENTAQSLAEPAEENTAEE